MPDPTTHRLEASGAEITYDVLAAAEPATRGSSCSSARRWAPAASRRCVATSRTGPS